MRVFIPLLIGLAVGRLPAETPYLGVTSPVRDATLSCVVPGRIEERVVREGQEVSKGEVLVRMDQRMEALEAERRKLIWKSRLELESAAAKAATAQADYQATQALFDRTGSISREEVDRKRLEAKVAEAERAALELAERREELEYRMALEQIDRRVFRAPWDGWVIELFFEEGETCEKGQPVVRIVDTRRCHLTVNLDAAAARELREGMEVRLLLDPEGGRVATTGTLDYVSPVIDPASGLQTVRAVFDNPNGRVRPGVSGLLLLEGE